MDVTLLPGPCFLCGATSNGATPQDLDEVKVFQTYFEETTEIDGSAVQTCASCAQDITSVWRLHQQLVAIKQDIANIVEKLKRGRKEGRIKQESEDNSDPVLENVDIIKEEIDRTQFENEEEPPAFQNWVKIEPDQLNPSLDDQEDGVFSRLLNPDPGRGPRRPKRSKNIGLDPLALDNPRDSDYTPPPPPKSKKAPRKTTHTLICPQCRQEFIGQRSLDTHINTIHLKLPPGRLRAPPPAPGPSGPFNCTHCGRGYQSRSSLVNHQQRAHPKLCCTSCALEFSTMSAWALHEATVCLVSGWNLSHLQKTFNLTLVPCPASECACGQLFDESDSASMQRHLTTHRNFVCGFGFVCQDCGELFFRTDKLGRHQTTQHPTTRKKYRCHKCPMIYYKQSFLSKHLEVHRERRTTLGDSV